jgi:hypothetical protein
VQSAYKEEFSRVDLSFETPACQNMSFGAKELNSIESSEMAIAEEWQERN